MAGAMKIFNVCIWNISIFEGYNALENERKYTMHSDGVEYVGFF